MSGAGIGEAGRLLGPTTAPLLARRLERRVQLAAEGHRAYPGAVEWAVGADIDDAMLIKLHAAPPGSETRYSPLECIGVRSQHIQGNREPAHISTSDAERQHLSTRMAMRRMTRLTNGFSEHVQSLQHATSLYSCPITLRGFTVRSASHPPWKRR